MSITTNNTKQTNNEVLHLIDIAETLRDDALSAARDKLNIMDQEQPLEHLLNQASFIDYLKYEIAIRVAEVLGANDKRIHSVYLYDPTMNPDCESVIDRPIDVTVHLLIQVSIPSAALEVLIDSLDRALISSFMELPSKIFEQRDFILNINLVSEEDVQLRRGYAALLASMFAPALKIWER